ncbi:MAG: sugar ABC transporter substrate-binding protein [Anaerolineae bacterium]|nr:sugar ABC transporter substrate-binding protein [Anaerolineae bacterium]
MKRLLPFKALLLAVVLFLLVAISGQPTIVSIGQSPTQSATQAADAMTLPKTTEPAGIGKTWVQWDKSTCAFKEVTDHPDKWSAVLRKQDKPFKVGYATQSETLSPILTLVDNNIRDNIKATGLTLIYGNNDYPSTTLPVTVAQTIALQKPDVFISFNVLDAIMEAVNKPFKDACIPVIQIEATAPGTVFFGTDNIISGNLAGSYLADYAAKKGWKSVTALGVRQLNVGASLDMRVTECQNAIKAKFPDAKVDNITSDSTATSQSATADWLTAHPNDKGILVCTMADIFAVGVANGFKGANRVDDGAVMGMLATADSRALIKAGGSALVASVDFNFAKFGDYLIPIAQDVVDGKPVPNVINQQLQVIDSTNVDK